MTAPVYPYPPSSVTNVPTVSETKRAFYNHHTRPITAVYRRVVEELLVEMHLLRVNGDFVYDGLYALGIITTYDRFMEGYQPQSDRDSILTALCQANGADVSHYRADAQALIEEVQGQSLDSLKAALSLGDGDSFPRVRQIIKGVGDRPRFKYSRAFAIGLYVLIEAIDPEFPKGKEAFNTWLQEATNPLPLTFEKLQKDVELYRSNLNKMEQAKAVMADILAADRKKREERAKAAQAAAEAKAAQATTEESDTPAAS